MSVDFYPARRSGNYIEAVSFDNAFNVSNASAIILLQSIGVYSEELVGELSISQVRQIADVIEEILAMFNPSLNHMAKKVVI